MSRQRRFKLNLFALAAALLAVSLLMPIGVKAIGITPGRTTIDFEPNLHREVAFSVLNNEHKDMQVLIYVKEGYLNTTVTLKNMIVDFKSEEDSKSFTYLVDLPPGIEIPGTHDVDVIAMELPKEKEGGTYVGATTAVVTQLRIRVPYPGKYIEADLATAEAKAQEPVNFYVKVFNFGTEEINSVKADIDILGPTNEKIASIETPETSLKSRERKEMHAVWETGANPGIYHAVVTVRYDGKVARVEKNFAVGNLFIDIEKVEVKDFKLGGIAKFTIFASSKWNREVSGVYGEMDINSGGGSDVADIKTANVNIGPLGKAELYAYWDTDGVDEGVYDTNLKLYYEGSTTEKKMKTSVSESEIKNEFVNLGTGAVTSNKAFFDRDTIIIAAVAVLVFINILWFLKFRRRKQIPRQAL